MRNLLEKGREGKDGGRLTSAVDEAGLGLRAGGGQQLVLVLVGAVGAGVMAFTRGGHDAPRHHVAQRVVQVPVQQAALVLGRRHVVLSQ